MLALVIGIVVYRIIVIKVFYRMENSSFFYIHARILTSLTAAFINLIFILFMNYVRYFLFLFTN